MHKFQINLAILLALIISLSCFAAKPNYELVARNILTAKVTPEVLDKLWSAYYATDNPAYIKRILEFVNQDNVLLVVGYEITNRNYICQVMQQRKFESDEQRKTALSHSCGKQSVDDLKRVVKYRYPKEYNAKVDQAVTVSAAIWSLDANQKQNKTVDMQIKKIIAANPKLDYWKKIKAGING